jgi:hypothetical protein
MHPCGQPCGRTRRINAAAGRGREVHVRLVRAWMRPGTCPSAPGPRRWLVRARRRSAGAPEARPAVPVPAGCPGVLQPWVQPRGGPGARRPAMGNAALPLPRQSLARAWTGTRPSAEGGAAPRGGGARQRPARHEGRPWRMVRPGPASRGAGPPPARPGPQGRWGPGRRRAKRPRRSESAGGRETAGASGPRAGGLLGASRGRAQTGPARAVLVAVRAHVWPRRAGTWDQADAGRQGRCPPALRTPCPGRPAPPGCRPAGCHGRHRGPGACGQTGGPGGALCRASAPAALRQRDQGRPPEALSGVSGAPRGPPGPWRRLWRSGGETGRWGLARGAPKPPGAGEDAPPPRAEAWPRQGARCARRPAGGDRGP